MLNIEGEDPYLVKYKGKKEDIDKLIIGRRVLN